jgi:protein involved in polysaccharide export with SLBB domain
MTRHFLFFAMLLVLGSALSAQVDTGAAQGDANLAYDSSNGPSTSISASMAVGSPLGNALIAATTADYPMTPGDTLSLAFLQSTKTIIMRLFVEADGSINAGIFGQLHTDGETYAAIKSKIENMVTYGYPGANPSIQIVSTGVFTVKVEGEVKLAGLRNAWGLTRLSEIASAVSTPFTDLRSIMIKTKKGDSHKYDLFKASREGDLANDPYVKPDDLLVFSKATRVVTILGAVHRPGSYQLQQGEGLNDLVGVYGDGLLAAAEPELCTIHRRPEYGRPDGEALRVDARKDALIFDGDIVDIPSASSYQSIIYVEGAIAANIAAAGGATDSAKINLASEYRVEHYPYYHGELLSTVLRMLATRISPMAALREGFIQRDGIPKPFLVNMENLLNKYESTNDFVLEAGDRVIIPLGAFEAFVTGEVTRSAFVNISGLTRLSTVVGPFFTLNSSIRDVAVVSDVGLETSYDLFRASRLGDLSQDPYLKPGDKVIVNKLDRLVSIQGAVRRPGSYQLLPSEQLWELLEVYAGGFTENADLSRIDLVRIVGGSDISGERKLIDFSATPEIVLANKDNLTVPTLQSLLPIVFFEGAVALGIAGTDTKAEPGISNRLPYQFYDGELLSSAIRANRERFTPEADLEKGYVLRNGVRKQIDFSKFLFDRDIKDTATLQAGDRIVIPFKQYFVTVGGAVMRPGRYPFVPDRGWRYYLGLAGGANQLQNAGEAHDIANVQGTKKGPDDSIEPEDSIVFASNNLLYIFGQISAVLTGLASIFSVIYTVRSLTK